MDQIEEIRSKIDIIQLISEYLPLKKSGRNFKALCPFHAEKTPSLVVSPERQIFKCFGCSVGGDIFGFLMKMEGMEFGEALRTLAKRAGVTLTTYHPTTAETEKEKLYQINHLAGEFYHYLLASHPVGQQARQYLKLKRGVSEETIRLFKLGYAPPLWEGLQKFLVGKKGYKPEELLKAGLVVGQTGRFRDFFRDRLIFPLKDHRGNVVGFSGRILSGDGPKYINTPETAVYHKADLLYGLETTKNAIKSQNQVIIVEGEFDLLSSWQAGVLNVVAIKGSALTESQLRLLKRFCENLVLALDRDLAGDTASHRGIELAELSGFNVQVFRLSESKDPDELARKNPEAWKEVVSSAQPVYDFLLESAFTRFDIRTALGKKKISEELLPILGRIANEIVKAHYLRQLATKLNVPEESLISQLKKLTFSLVPSVAPSVPVETRSSRRDILEEYLFALALQSEEPEILLQRNVKTMIRLPALVRMIALLDQLLTANKAKKFNSQKLTKILPPELLEIFNNFYLIDFGEKIFDKKWLQQEKEKILHELKKVDLQEKLKDLSLQIAHFEERGKEQEVEELKEKFLHLSQQLGSMAKLL